MKKRSLTILCLSIMLAMISFTSRSQVTWFTDYEGALSLAKASGKLVFIDFYADWCGPCRKMDSEVWSTPEMLEKTSSFILVKVDIDRYPQVATTYNVTAIPRMLLVDPFENQIDEITGFQNTATMARFFSDYPGEIAQVVVALGALEGKENETAANFLSAGNAFLSYLPSLEGKAHAKFGGRANFYLGKAAGKAKKEKNESLAIEVVLAQSRLAIEQNNYSRALKKIEQLDMDEATAAQRLALDEMCITCLYKDDKQSEARDYYDRYTAAHDSPKTFDELIKETDH